MIYSKNICLNQKDGTKMLVRDGDADDFLR